MLRAFKAGHVGTDFGNYLERGRRVDTVDPGQIDTAQSKQVSSHIELRCILGVRCASTPARIAIIIANERCQHAFEFGVTFSQQRSIIIIERHRLLECEQMLLAPVALKRLGDLLFTGANAGILHLRQHMTVTFARNNTTYNFLPRFANDV